jgi:hypothetical protein
MSRDEIFQEPGYRQYQGLVLEKDSAVGVERYWPTGNHGRSNIALDNFPRDQRNNSLPASANNLDDHLLDRRSLDQAAFVLTISQATSIAFTALKLNVPNPRVI